MTLCAAIEVPATRTVPAHVVLACDSFLGGDASSDKIDRPKWFQRAGVTVAYAGELALAQALQNTKLPWRRRRRNEDPVAYACTVIVPVIRALNGHQPVRTSFLVVVGGQVLFVGDDLGVSRSSYGYNAIGIGAVEAMVVMRVLRDLPRPPSPAAILERTLAAVAEHLPGVALPLRMERIE